MDADVNANGSRVSNTYTRIRSAPSQPRSQLCSRTHLGSRRQLGYGINSTTFTLKMTRARARFNKGSRWKKVFTSQVPISLARPYRNFSSGKQILRRSRLAFRLQIHSSLLGSPLCSDQSLRANRKPSLERHHSWEPPSPDPNAHQIRPNARSCVDVNDERTAY